MRRELSFLLASYSATLSAAPLCIMTLSSQQGLRHSGLMLRAQRSDSSLLSNCRLWLLCRSAFLKTLGHTGRDLLSTPLCQDLSCLTLPTFTQQQI